MGNELQVMSHAPLTVDAVKAQVNRIQEIMRDVMQKDQHYGVVPGCGDKPALLKPGAEKIMFTFQLVPDPLVEVIDLPHPTVAGHREYRVTVKLYAKDGTYLGGGVGSCSTMETKYRFRDGDGEVTEKPVPKEYWDLRKTDQMRAQELLGGKGFKVHKTEAGWMIAKKGEKVEFSNPADYYNTCEKMAKKRALVDATLTVTAASDIFTQDIDEMLDGETVVPPAKSSIPQVRQPVGNRDFGMTPPPTEPVHRDNPFDDPYPKPSKPAADGPQSQEATPPTAEAQPRRDDPPAHKPQSAAEFARKQAEAMSDDPYVDGILGNFQPYQGAKAFQKGAKPGMFDVEDGQGGIIMHGVKYFDPDLDVSSGLKRVYYKTDSYNGRTQYNAVRIESLDATE